MQVEAYIVLEDPAGGEDQDYTVVGSIHPAEPDVGIMGPYCDEFWLEQNRKVVERELTPAEEEACVQALFDAYDTRNDNPED